jgi:hypothetical protein
MFICPINNHNWRNISTVFIYITRLASNEIFSPSNKIHREVGRATDLSAPWYLHNNVPSPRCLMQTLDSKPTTLTPLQKPVQPTWRLTTCGIWRCTIRQLITRTHAITSHKISSHHQHDSLKSHTTFKINLWFFMSYTGIVLKYDNIHNIPVPTLTNTILIM